MGEIIKEEKEEEFELGSKMLKEIAKTNGFTQPILYLEKIPVAEAVEKIIEEQGDAILHTSPLLSSSCINASVLNNLNNKEYTDNIGPLANKLYLKEANIVIDQLTYYTIQNTLIAFCNMLDYTGKLFRSIIDYLPIKAYVVNELNDKENYSTSIYNFFSNIIKRYDNYTFSEVMMRRDENEYLDQSKVMYNYHVESAMQLAQIIYTKLCKSCDLAISEVLLGTRVSPNLKYIVEAGCTYFGIKNTGIDAKNLVYFKLNAALTNMIDKFMQNTITPMCNAICQNYIFSSFFYAYGMIDKTYQMDVEDVFEEKIKNAPKRIEEDLDDEYGPFFYDK